MIDFIQGKVHSLGEDYVVLEREGLGFKILSTARTLSSLKKGEQAFLYTVLVVREDDMSLYGFSHADERTLYELLTTVKGIGPRVAINILGGISPGEVRTAILTEDSRTLQQAPGIGKKTAERIILELKDKIAKEDFEDDPEIPPSTRVSERDDAVEALISLGYTYSEATGALEKVEETDDISGRIREALKILSK